MNFIICTIQFINFNINKLKNYKGNEIKMKIRNNLLNSNHYIEEIMIKEKLIKN